jgi:hypothetical protein
MHQTQCHKFFCGNYQVVVALNGNNISSENKSQFKVLELYKSKHPKKVGFLFIHSCLILKDVGC